MTRPPPSTPPDGAGAPASSGGMAVASQPFSEEQAVGATLVRGAMPAGAQPESQSELELDKGPTHPGNTRPELPGFELQVLLGRGGMGEVWRARQQSLGRTVAVKLLPPRLAKDAEFVTRFDKEATALASLSHPNITQIIDRGVAGEHYYFAMEYVEGHSLREEVGRLAPQHALRILHQVARAMEYAHEKGIVHRDLKPENILLDGRGHVKVADFGLAGIRQPDSKLNLTATSVAMGTLNYMAPEQRRDAKNVDGRADLFSLGVVMYEALTGELPLGRFKPPSARVAGLDARVDAVVERLLENEPQARYASASEVCAALEPLLSHSSVSLAPGEAGPVKGRLHRGWRRRVLAGLVAVSALGGVGFMARQLVGPVQPRVGGDEGPGGAVVTPAAPKAWPPNTNRELFVASTHVEEAGAPTRLGLSFDVGQEELNAWSGEWRLVDGELRVRQGGNQSEGKLIPRAYVAHRYFSSDDFSAEVLMDVRPLGSEYPDEAEAQHFGELAFRIKDLQVSAFAIPGVGMRLSWRYTTADGEEVVGNSAQDLEALVEDEMPVPATGPFQVRLRLKRRKVGTRAGVEVEAFVNGERFARKVLPGLEGRVAKVALGCRNLACTFDELKVQGAAKPRPRAPKKVGGRKD